MRGHQLALPSPSQPLVSRYIDISSPSNVAAALRKRQVLYLLITVHHPSNIACGAMAEPITAFGTAAAALQVGKMAIQTGSYLWKLGRAISQVDSTVTTLAAETNSLGQVCNFIEQEIQGVLSAKNGGTGDRDQYDDSGHFWESVNLQLVQTKVTIDELNGIVGGDVSVSRDFFQRARKHMHLDKNKNELEAIRRRLHIHSQSLEMALQMVNMSVTNPDQRTRLFVLTLPAVKSHTSLQGSCPTNWPARSKI